MKRALLALALCSCGTLLPANGPPTTAPVFAVMGRLGTLGWWPAYEITVYANGIVEYHGVGSVRVVGKRTTDIGPAGVELLRRELARAHFMELEDDYTSHVYDVPGISWINYQGKTVDFEGGVETVPQELFDLAFEFERLSNSKQWTDWPEGYVGSMP